MDSIKSSDVSIEIPGSENTEPVKSKGVKFFLAKDEGDKSPEVSIPNGPKKISFSDITPKKKAVKIDSGISTGEQNGDDLSTNDTLKLVTKSLSSDSGSKEALKRQDGSEADATTPAENGTVKKGILKHSNTTPELSSVMKEKVSTSRSFKDLIKEFGATQDYENPGFEFGEKVPEVPKLSDVVKSLLDDNTPSEVHPYGSGSLDKEKRSILATHGQNIVIWVMFSGMLIFGLAGGIIFAAATFEPAPGDVTTTAAPESVFNLTGRQ